MPEPPQQSRRRMVAAYYDRLAPVYGEGAYFQARRAAILNIIAAELAPARVVLDLGCGNGAYTAGFAAQPHIQMAVGADLSPGMLEAARRRLGGAAQFVRADATALPFLSSCFDLVFMSHVLLLIPDIEACVRQTARVLATGGALAATIGASSWRESVHSLLSAAEWEQLQSLFVTSRFAAAADDEQRVTAACTQAGLQPELRRAVLHVGWPAVAEWVRIRWLSLMDATQRATAEQVLTALGERARDLDFRFEETVLVARRRA